MTEEARNERWNAFLEALVRRLETMETTVARHSALLEPRVAREQELPARVWGSAPLFLRLSFLRDLLGGEHPHHATLREAGELVQLCGRAAELETWLQNYPLLFVEAATRLLPSESGPGEAERLAAQTLAEARAEVDTFLRSAGGEWIFPAVGAAPTNEHEVLADEAAEVPAGNVARVLRPGLRWRGQVLLPAQIVRASGAKQPNCVPEIQPPAEKTSAAIPGGDRIRTTRLAEEPEWYRSLLRHSLGETQPAVTRMMDGLAGLLSLAGETPVGTARLRGALAFLLPLLSPSPSAWPDELPKRWLESYEAVSEPLRAWLDAVFGVRVIWPQPGAEFDPITMDAVSVRRTAHPRERGKVARAQSSGLQSREQILCRAQVIRYETGGRE